MGALGSACEGYSCCQGARAAKQVVKLLQCYLAACRASERTQISQSIQTSYRARCHSMQNIGQDALPHAICELYEANPSRDLWKGMLQEWMQQASSRASGAFGHYYMKCCLDRLFSVRQMCHGTISWWPTECPSYKKWYGILYPKQRLDDNSKFQVLCAIYLKLNAARNSSFPNALAQTCWYWREKNKRLALT